MIATYDYPANWAYNETIAILADGREYNINTQYGKISPLGNATLDGVDQVALLAEARIHGKTGRPPQPKKEINPKSEKPEWKSARGLTLSEEMDREDSAY